VEARPVSGISVSVERPTEAGRLHPVYDADAGILSAESHVAREWPQGVDVDGNIVLDVDASGVLANFDLHVGKKLWPHGEVNWPGAGTAKAGDIRFSTSALARKSFHLALRVAYNPEDRSVHIAIGERSATRFVCLSEDCIALVDGDDLVGFLVRGFD